MENALNPQDPRPTLRGRRRAAVHPQPAVLLGRRPDELGRLPHPARRSTPPSRPTPRPSASRSGPSTTSSNAPRPAVSAALVRTSAAAARAGHHRHGRRADALAAGLSRPRSSTATTWPGPSTGSRSCGPIAGRGLARPCPGRARPAADAGHRRRSSARTATPRSGRCWIRSWRRSRPRTSGSPTATSARPTSSSGSPGGAAPS